jgi:hypothetical protein
MTLIPSQSLPINMTDGHLVFQVQDTHSNAIPTSQRDRWAPGVSDGCQMNLEAYINMTSPTPVVPSSLEELAAAGGSVGPGTPRHGAVFDEGSFLEAFGYVVMPNRVAR